MNIVVDRPTGRWVRGEGSMGDDDPSRRASSVLCVGVHGAGGVGVGGRGRVGALWVWRCAGCGRRIGGEAGTHHDLAQENSPRHDGEPWSLMI